MHARGGTLIKVLPPTPNMAVDPTWRWLSAMSEHVGVDWLGQEIFDIMMGATLHGDIANLVHCQARILASICPSGAPTRESWLWSWRLANNAATSHRWLTQVRPVHGTAAAFN
jgi:hypothetical protein